MTGRWHLVAALVVLSSAPASLFAQGTRAQVSTAVSGSVSDPRGALAVDVAGGFRLTPAAGFELQLLYVPSRETLRQTAQPQTFPPVPTTPGTSVTTRTTALLSSFVADHDLGRLRPYGLLGGGIANLQRETLESSGATAITSTGSVTATPLARVTRSENTLALTAGGGLAVRVWKNLSTALDVRYLQFLGTSTQDADHVTRVGARIGYAF